MKYIDVTWVPINGSYDQCLGFNKAVYALIDSNSRIYYIGKADEQTIRERLNDPGKQGMLRILRESGNVAGGVLCGIVSSLGKYLLPSADVSNVEALLIREEAPWGNVVKPNITEDTHITCKGSWRGKQNVYQHITLPRIGRPVLSAKPRLQMRPLLPEPPRPASTFFSDMMAMGGAPKNGGLFAALMSESKKR